MMRRPEQGLVIPAAVLVQPYELDAPAAGTEAAGRCGHASRTELNI